jgi:CHAT domain-containing protein/tetratricopeptide (TPR) repeat protein
VTTKSRCGVWLSGVLAIVLATSASASGQTDPFARCREPFERNPENYDASYCFYEVTFEQRLWEEGARQFEALIVRYPTNLWLPLAYGHVYRSRDPDRAEALYRRAADGFRKAGHAEGEILARSNLRHFLFPKGRVKEAAAEMERVVEIGDSVSDPLLKARAWTLEAAHLQESGGDLGHAFRLLKQTEAAIFPNGPYRLKRTTLVSLGQVAFRLGRLDDALAVFRKLDALAAEEGEALARANAQFNILNTSLVKESLLPSRDSKQKLMRLAEQSLATAVAAGNRDTTLKTHRAIAELFAAEATSKTAALEHVEHCLALAVTMRQPQDEAVCSWVKASLLRDSAPAVARASELRALDATERANSPRTQAYSAGRRMRLSWETKPRSHAISDSLEAINAIETLRSLQDVSESSAELFSTWTSDYYWLSGRLLQDRRDEDLALAFSITERMRARSLLDALERSRAAPDPGHAAVKQRRALLEAIAGVQRRLMDPTIQESDRRASLAKLEDLERREQEARRIVGLTFGERPGGKASFPDLQSIQSALAPNEALLSFQTGVWETYDGTFGGGSWLVALTRDRHSIHRLPDRAQLVPVVPVFAGLLDRSDELGATSAVRLHKELLSEALNGLPSDISRLILVPDGVLHHLPFDALRQTVDGPPLGVRYELTIAPSATLWLYWRTRPPQIATRRALAFADPILSVSVSATNSDRNAALVRGLRLGRLPHARRESRAIERHFGDVEALVGERASEDQLKRRNLQNYDLLHFAAHAISDEVRPERSAVLLAADGETEDGLLQSREIERLNLDGRIIVLSACQTASGAVLSGEGVLSLARAFFAAGAHAVIGSRWPIRDADAAALFESFYRFLARGASLSEALMQTKIEAIASGRPASVWAGLVLVGRGDLRPFPVSDRPASRAGWPVAAVLIAVVGAVVGLRRLWKVR